MHPHPYTHAEDSLSESEDEEGAVSSSKKDKPLAALQKKLRELNTAYELVEKNNHMLVQQIAETEVERKEVTSKLKERLALFKLTADAMVKVMKRRLGGVREGREGEGEERRRRKGGKRGGKEVREGNTISHSQTRPFSHREKGLVRGKGGKRGGGGGKRGEGREGE